MDNYRYVDLGNNLSLVNISGGLVNKGAYDAATNYAVGEAVSYNGSSYVMYVDAPAGTVPTNTTYWQLLASKGDTGATGPTGPQGATGPAGQGVPVGGSTNQILSKIDGTDYNTQWIDNIPQAMRHYVKNSSGVTINKGEAVYVSGANGTNVLVSKAQANSDATSARTLGLAATTMTNNQFGYVISEGTLAGIDTSGATADGDTVYLSGSVAGGLIYGYANKPMAPTHLVYIGVVAKKNPSTGEIWVKVQNGYELDEIHDVQITSVANNQTIMYDSSTSLWKNHTLVKGDVGLGNVDNTSDANKPISTATQTALDGKVDENASITGATKTKITYDSKGLVTAGADAAVADITGLQTALDAKVTGNTAITGATKTKITYDAKGLVTAGADAAIADITGLQTALDGKEATITAGTTAQYWRGDKSWQTLNKSAVGLSNVDNIQQMPLSYLDTDTTLAANSDVKVPSQKAIKTYADNLIGNANAVVYKGVIDCSTNPNYPAANAGDLYIVSVAGKIGGASGINVETGDLAICNTDGTASGNQATVGAYWNIIQKNIDGAVTGPASSTTNNVAFFNDTTGKVIKDSGLTLSGSNTGDETNATIKTKLGSASTSVDGYLTSTDFTTFNNKENAITAGTTSQYFRGDKTFQTLDKTAVGLGNVTNDAQVKYSAPQLGANLDLNNEALSIIATAGENLVSGNLCYLKSDGKWWKASNTAAATASSRLAIANATINANATGELIVFGQYTTTGLTAGSVYFVGAAGAITTTTPTTEDYVVRPVGTASSTTTLEFNPSTSWITYKA